MGWGSLLGDLAKGFAKDYIEERGVKGTIEDVGDLAKGVKNFFSSSDNSNTNSPNNNYSSNNDNTEAEQFLELYNEFMEEEKYQNAEDLVDNFYIGSDKDEYWYFFKAQIHNAIGVDNNSLDEINKAKSFIGNAYNQCEIGTEFMDEIKSLRNTINENYSYIKSNQSAKNKPKQTKQTNQASQNSSNQQKETDSGNEKEYIEELKACLEDGEISDKEKRLLDKLRKSLGISEQRAAEIENQLRNGGLSSEEQEYLTELKDCMEDGTITDKERRLLNKIRVSLGISESRATELEAIARKG